VTLLWTKGSRENKGRPYGVHSRGKNERKIGRGVVSLHSMEAFGTLQNGRSHLTQKNLMLSYISLTIHASPD